MITAALAGTIRTSRGVPCHLDQLYTYTTEGTEHTVAIMQCGSPELRSPVWQAISQSGDGLLFDTSLYSSKAALVCALYDGAHWQTAVVTREGG